MQLYELTQEMLNIKHMGYDNDTTDELLEAYKIEGADQISELIKAMKQNDAEMNTLAYEIARLSDMKAKRNKQNESFKKVIDFYLRSNDITGMRTDMAVLSYLKSEAVIIDPTAELHEDYLRTKTVIEPDKVKIKSDLKKGIIIGGAHIEVRQNLQIK